MKKTLLVLLGAVSISACSNAVKNPATPLDASQLANRAFVLTAVDGKKVTKHEGMKPGINFSADMKVKGVMCNRFFGQGKLEQGRLVVPQMASTRMMCSDPDLNAWEQTLSSVLVKGAVVNLTTETLTLTGRGHTLEYKAQ